MTQYQNLIYSICYRLTGDYFDAEDLAQDTFLSAYRHLPDFDGENEKAWLCRIATNKCIDYLKRAGRRSVPTEDVYFSSLPDSRSSPEKEALEHEIQKRLFESCNQLEPPYRQAALDYYYYEMDINEIAAKTGKNKKTLQTQIYRAKGMLRVLLGKEVLRDA
ncbi:MAG: sigma-70 family RNA polymerase sigma factor [Lachnospiraceae bacterium]|nr:sigma-70 family RNA polymerase sigma factor [Lachnospiraceae bacterium]